MIQFTQLVFKGYSIEIKRYLITLFFVPFIYVLNKPRESLSICIYKCSRVRRFVEEKGKKMWNYVLTLMHHLTQVTKLVQRQFIYDKARKRNKRKDKKKCSKYIHYLYGK
jgi:hypothetical protein